MKTNTLVSMRTADVDPHIEQVPGTKSGFPCSKCGADVMVSPSGQKRIEIGAPLICTHCFKPTTGEIVNRFAPGAREEFVRHMAGRNKN